MSGSRIQIELFDDVLTAGHLRPIDEVGPLREAGLRSAVPSSLRIEPDSARKGDWLSRPYGTQVISTAFVKLNVEIVQYVAESRYQAW